MGRFEDGRWVDGDFPHDGAGRFARAPTSFRDWVTEGGRFEPASGRYHVYVSLACPWAHRVLIGRSLRGLDEVFSVSVVEAYMGPDGWTFSEDGPTRDHINGCRHLRDVYLKAAHDYSGRVTVPVLWDKQTGTIVNNESREILRMIDTVFEPFAERSVDLWPEAYREAIEATIDAIYEPVNNGVYKCGFARTQSAYDEAVSALFDGLEALEERLDGQRYLCGPVFTEADICLFTTLVRFDPVYHTHFKCNRKQLTEFPNLWGFVREVYQMPGVAETCSFEHIRTHYYTSHESVNPRRIVPVGPDLDLTAPHGRDRF